MKWRTQLSLGPTGRRLRETDMYRLRNRTLLLGCWLLVPAAILADSTALRVLRPPQSGVPLLTNGTFDKLFEGRPTGWRGWGQGFQLAPKAGRGGSAAVACEHGEGGGEFGASQTIVLHQTTTAPFLIRGWSKAQNVSGTPDSGYSLYVDLIYRDGSPLWGQTVNFSCGTHDWEPRQLLLLPDKPVQSLTLHCLFRGHTGHVWFDDVSLEEIPTPAGAVVFQGVPVVPVQAASGKPQGGDKIVATDDGLKLTLRDHAVTSLASEGQALGCESPAGFLVRDFAANSDVQTFTDGVAAKLGLKLQATYTASSNHIAVTGRLVDTAGRDRAVTLLFALPVDASGWWWGEDMRQSRRIQGNGEFANTVNLPSGANGKMSRYPLAAIWNERTGLALGLDMDQPAQYRLVYHAGTRQFFMAYDFGLVRETQRAPGSAGFRFVIYRFDPRWGFRSALQKYYEIFPQQFVRRVPREGTWMPFTDIAKVPGYADFGFAFQEGAPNVAFDDQHGISSFVYVEPMSHWLAMPPETPRTYAGALAVLGRDLAGARGRTALDLASATLTSGIQGADGRFSLRLEKAPWCDGGVFLLNPDPEVPTHADQPVNKAQVMRAAIADAFEKNRPKSPTGTNGPFAGLDGVYLDSFEMGASALNYRREHFGTARVPLGFDRDGRPCELMIFATWQFAHETAARMHAEGRLMFANAVLWQFSFPAPLLDVLGTEVNWLNQGRYHPDSDAVMNFRRALCRQKPYCLLMNTDYARFTPELVERYFQCCLFYGLWPGFFDEEAASKDPYWTSPRCYYDRDRSIFRKYIPLLQKLAVAGWQPLTQANSQNPDLLLERFGPDADGTVYLTVLNDSDELQTGVVSADMAALGLAPPLVARELISGKESALAGSGWSVTLPPHATALVAIQARRP